MVDKLYFGKKIRLQRGNGWGDRGSANTVDLIVGDIRVASVRWLKDPPYLQIEKKYRLTKEEE